MEEWHKALQEDAVRTVWWEADAVCLIDQTKLPHTRAVVRCSTVVEVSAAIRSMVVRGAGDRRELAGTSALRGTQRSSKYRYLSKLWRHHCRVEVIEEEALYEGLSASHSDLVEDVGEMVLYCVLGDVKGCGYLPS
jgi:hypothetical protein